MYPKRHIQKSRIPCWVQSHFLQHAVFKIQYELLLGKKKTPVNPDWQTDSIFPRSSPYLPELLTTPLLLPSARICHFHICGGFSPASTLNEMFQDPNLAAKGYLVFCSLAALFGFMHDQMSTLDRKRGGVENI